MYQAWIRGTVAAGAALGVLWASTALAATPLHTFLNGSELNFDVPPMIVEGRTLVPVRTLATALGGQVTWDAGSSTVGLVVNGVNIQLVIGAAQARVDGRAVPLDVPPQVVDGRTLVPLRFVSESFGARVTWDAATETINIDTRDGRTVSRGDRTTFLVVTDGPLRLRTGPGTNYDIIADLPTGARLEGSVSENGWWRVKTGGGSIGWVSGQFVAPAPPDAPASATGAAIVKAAMKGLGAPYAYGGATPAGFDCSGFTTWAFAQVGIRLPRTAAEQYQLGKPVTLANLQPGDLMFWDTDGDGISHVGIFVGNGQFIHAENAGTGVVLTAVNKPWWSARYVGARRVGA